MALTTGLGRGRFTVAAVAVSTAIGVAAAPSASAAPSVTTVLTGLNAPRGVAFDGDGRLYVSESGAFSGTTTAELTRTGRVTAYRPHDSAWKKVWASSGFESLSAAENGPEVLGPEGISAVGDDCSSGGDADGCQVRMIMSESIDGVAATTHLTPSQLGFLYALDPRTGRPHRLLDVGDRDYRWTGQHKSLAPHDFPDANPYAVLITGRGGGQRDDRGHRDDEGESRLRTFVADAGANTINEVRGGSLRVVAYIPNDAQFDATPTCMAMGRDGMLYVGTLDLLTNSTLTPKGPQLGANPGHSNIWRVDPNASYPTPPQLWATGLTTVTACTFDRAGNFWATEMFHQNVQGPPGDLVKIPAREVADRRTDDAIHIGGGSIPLPGGIAQGRDGALYVSVNSANPVPGSGQVLRVSATS